MRSWWLIVVCLVACSTPPASHFQRRQRRRRLRHTSELLALGLIGCGATRPPFVGDWKLNPSRSQVTDVMKVDSVDGNKYTFDFGGGPETIVADGTDQPGSAGTTFAVTIDAPDRWNVVRKKNGRVIINAHWKLSADRSSLSDDYTELADNGQASVHATYLYHRTGDGSGFAGVWEGTIAMASSQTATLQIRPYDADGLSFNYVSAHVTRNLKFDGKDYPVVGAGAAEGATSSARWVDDHTLQVTDKTKGKVTKTQELELSRDHKTVTQTNHPVGAHGPTVFVFERQS